VGEGAKRRTGLVFSAMIARDLEQGEARPQGQIVRVNRSERRTRRKK
jgi:hypothetical protein